MNEHSSVAIDERLEDAIVIWQKANGCLNHVVCLRRVQLRVLAHIIVMCLDKLTDTEAVQISVLDI